MRNLHHLHPSTTTVKIISGDTDDETLLAAGKYDPNAQPRQKYYYSNN